MGQLSTIFNSINRKRIKKIESNLSLKIINYLNMVSGIFKESEAILRVFFLGELIRTFRSAN